MKTKCVFHRFIEFCVCHAKMSLVTYNPANQLDEDVLLVIFDQLDEEELLRCETVCHQW